MLQLIIIIIYKILIYLKLILSFGKNLSSLYYIVFGRGSIRIKGLRGMKILQSA